MASTAAQRAACVSRQASSSSWHVRTTPAPLAAVLAIAINLDRRTDRLQALRRHEALRGWERLAASDGRDLSWDALQADGLVHAAAVREARWALAHRVPTICRATGSFSPHLTLSAVGCALSHRRAWERLHSHGADWALVIEDDVCAVAPLFVQKLLALVRQLPSSWEVCWLGYHESSGTLLPAAAPPAFVELAARVAITGLFGYVLRRSAAARLLHNSSGVFPLRHQVDVVLCAARLGPATKFAVPADAVLLAAPKSEEGACDTDVQTLGEPRVRAHDQLPSRGMLRL